MIRRQRGFTLVELLVVIAIIGILIAMLMPAVQAARETGRRAVCASNMTRLALATDGYRSAHGYYPPGVTDSKGPILSQPSGMHHNWIKRLLPYLDQRAVASKIDDDVSVYDPKNAAIRKLRLSELLCPSDDVVSDVPHSSYAACHHDVESTIDADNHGVFFLNSKVRPDDITDGLAYTLFISEKQTEGNGTDLGWLSGTRATLRNTGTPLNMTGPRSPIALQAAAEEKALLRSRLSRSSSRPRSDRLIRRRRGIRRRLRLRRPSCKRSRRRLGSHRNMSAGSAAIMPAESL